MEKPLFKKKSDEELKINNKASNNEKIEFIYNQYKNKMFWTAKRLLIDDYLAENVVHDSMVKVIKQIEKIDMGNYKKLEGLIELIVVRTSKNIISKREKTQPVPNYVFEDFDLSYIETEYEKIDDRAEELLNLISEKYREVLRLKIVENMDYEEISKKLNIKVSTLRKQYQRGIRLLLCKIEKNEYYEKKD